MAQTQLNVQSDAFTPGGWIPARYTGDGENVSPPLAWSGLPAATKEVAVVVEDPDAPTQQPFAHWLMYHIPPTVTSLPEGISGADDAGLPVGSAQGRNSFEAVGYGGPAPPAGKTHRYRFKVFALDQRLEAKPGANRQELLEAMKDHVLASGELVGKYGG